MSCRYQIVASAVVLATIGVLAPARSVAAAPPNASVSLRSTAFEPLPLGSIQPAGWLRDQLRIQAKGLSGHLDEFWPDIQDSAWFGGKAEGWERVP
jgi:hypothetical protein